MAGVVTGSTVMFRIREGTTVVDSQGRSDERPVDRVFYPTDRIPFVEWREFSGAKPTVALVAAVTVLAFVTGLSNLSQPQLVVEGPLAGLPGARAFVRFFGVLLAFPLALVTFGLSRRRRIAWIAALALVPLLALFPFFTGQTTEIPLFLLILAAVPMLVANRGEFDTTLALSSLQIASLTSILGVVLYGTVGAYGLRDQFFKLTGWGDAFYYVIVTIATVGYGDITPRTAEAELFSLSVILLGTGAFTVAVGALIGPAIESRMASAFGTMTASELALLEDHVVVLGYGDVTESFLDQVADGTDLVVITTDTDAAARLSDAGIEVLTDDPTDESALEDARIDAARGVAVASDDDATNVLAVLATRNVNPDVRVVAVANGDTHVDKLEAVGADEVLDLRSVGGRLLGATVLDPEAAEDAAPTFDELLGRDGASEASGDDPDADPEPGVREPPAESTDAEP
jgi:voltage-gated potassium channel